MKLTMLLFFVGIGYTFGSVYSQDAKINVDVKQGTIVDVFDQIENQSQYKIFYKVNDIDLKKRVNVSAQNESVKNILNAALSEVEASFDVVEKIIVVKSVANSQEITIKGTVKDAEGNSLPGVNIIEKGTTNGTVTDLDGAYTISVSSADAVLSFSFIGYLTEDISVAGQTTLDITLVEDIQSLEEVVVVGYGVQKKSVVTGSISSVDSEALKNSSISRAEQALQGKTSGVQVLSNSGAPGAGMNIRIRGYGSNLSSEPIYIVNGTKVQDLSSIDPNDISNIEILKDAASAAIYGAEGANGVVLVTTKSGEVGTSKITYEYQHTMSSLARKVDVLNAADYKTYMTEAGTLPTSALSDPYDTDWQDEIFEPSPTQKHYLSFTNGNDKGSFLLSASYLDQDGVVAGQKDKYQRYSLMFNSEYKLKDWVKVGHYITLTKTNLKAVSENSEYTSVITSALMLDPLTPVNYENDSEIPATVVSGISSGNNYLKNEDGKYYGVSQYVSSTANPFVTRDATYPESENNNLFGNVFMELTPIKGLTFTSRFGGRIVGYRSHLYEPVYYYDATTNNLASSVEEIQRTTNYWQWENFAIYNKAFGNHNVTLLAGMSASENRLYYLEASGSTLTTDSQNYDDLDFLSANPSDDVSSYRMYTTKASYFGRLNYEYDNKYLLQGSLRRDGAGSDVLPTDTRWGIFPAVSAGWVISRESFFPQNTPITFVKIRGSWGQNGSLSNLEYLQYEYAAPLVSSGTYPYYETSTDASFGTATAPANLSNPSLKWETSEQTDIGLEIRADNDRISFTMDYYVKKTKDLLTDGTPSLIAGNDATTVNAGNVENRGFEFDLSYRNFIGDLSYNMSANLATLHNEVTYMNPNQPYLTGASINLETATRFDIGNPIWYFYGYKTDGIDPATGNPLYINADGETVTTVSSEDKTYIGSGIPKIMYGFNLDFGYKGFDFKAFLQGAAGHDVMLGMVRTDRLNFNKLQIYFDDRWTATNTDATMPAATTESNAWHSDLMIFDGDYLKIKQIQLGYTLPGELTKQLKISNLRIYTSIENLATFTKYPGVDPEVGSTSVNSLGIDRGMYPFVRSVLFGASISF